VIGLSMFEEQEQAKAMLSAGASAYLTKSGPADSVLAAIRAAGTAGPAATPDADRPDRPASNRGKARRPAKRRSKVAVRRPKA
jgi:DNA-binding NarL/FixJ family response regulator